MDIVLKKKNTRIEVTVPKATELVVVPSSEGLGVEVPRAAASKTLLASSDIRETFSTSCEVVRDQAGKIIRIIHSDGVVDLVYVDGRISGILKNGRSVSILRDQSGRIYGIGVN